PSPPHTSTLSLHDALPIWEANAVLGPVVGERSVLLLDGAEHLRQRKLMLPPFHGERMRAYGEVMREATDRSIDSWPVDEPFTLRDRKSTRLNSSHRTISYA